MWVCNKSVLCGCKARCEDTGCGHCNATTCGSERKVVMWTGFFNKESTNLDFFDIVSV